MQQTLGPLIQPVVCVPVSKRAYAYLRHPEGQLTGSMTATEYP